MGKRRNLTLDEYIEETTKNINEDRAMAKTLLVDMMADMATSASDRRELGPVAAKFIETLQRSNEQMVRLTALVQKQKSQHVGLTDDDRQQLFDLLNDEGNNDG
jgi:hypothetical protein